MVQKMNSKILDENTSSSLLLMMWRGNGFLSIASIDIEIGMN